MESFDEIRKELLQYYQWIFTMALSILSASLGLISFIGLDKMDKDGILFVGWFLLVICMFFNWLIIKNLVVIPLLKGVNQYARIENQLKIYGSLQNNSFATGILLILAYFLINLFR